MKVNWPTLRKFITDTNLYNFVNYFDIVTGLYVWISYQNENFSTILESGTVNWEDFNNNFKLKAILKNDINEDGISISKSRHVMYGRFFRAQFVLITTSTKVHNDETGYFVIKLIDENGNETNNENEAIKTCIDFSTPFTYELYGDGIEMIDEFVSGEIILSTVLNPDLDNLLVGKKPLIINKVIVKCQEPIFKSATIPGEIPEKIQDQQTNCLRTIIQHPKGAHLRCQIEIQYYA